MTTEDYVLLLREIANDISPSILPLVNEIILQEKFQQWSGSSKPHQHHYGKGGLIRHTYEVVENALVNAKLHNARFKDKKEMQVSLLEVFLSALFHDVGKMWDYAPVNEEMSEWTSTDHKRHIHHISRSGLEWQRLATKYGMSRTLTDNVLHNVLSHHGRREWGSPVAPNTRAAWIIHLADMLSARLDDVAKCDILEIHKKVE